VLHEGWAALGSLRATPHLEDLRGHALTLRSASFGRRPTTRGIEYVDPDGRAGALVRVNQDDIDPCGLQIGDLV
jgi:hypothetical protein